MTRRKHIRSELHRMLLTTATSGINVRKTFVLSQHKNYPKPYAKSELGTEVFERARDEATGLAAKKNFDGVASFAIYAGFDSEYQDTNDEELLEDEADRIFDIIEQAVDDYDWQDAILDNGATFSINAVYCTGMQPAILDSEMSGQLLVEGAIEYSHNHS